MFFPRAFILLLLSSLASADPIRIRAKYDPQPESSNLSEEAQKEKAIAEKESNLTLSKSTRATEAERLKAAEIAEWLRLWIQSPEVFENWITLRRKTADFISKFGEI